MKFRLSFTRKNKLDSMEKDIFTLEIESQAEPARLIDFAQGTALVSFGYQGVTESYKIANSPDHSDVLILEKNTKSVFRLWMSHSDSLINGDSITVSEGEYNQSEGRITLRSW